MEVTRIFDILQRHKEKYFEHYVIAGKDSDTWKEYSVKQYIEYSNNISYALLALGIKKGDKIASITENRPEWNFLDMGVLQTGAIHIPIYPTISDEDYQHIFNHAQVKYIFVSGENMLRRIRHFIPSVPGIKDVYTFENIDGNKNLGELMKMGEKNQQADKLEEIKKSISEDDIATIIYTSGTMGVPKGVLLSHKNIITNAKATSHILPYGYKDKALSFLPLCHIYERMINYMFQYTGISLYYCGNMGAIVDNLNEVHPVVMSTVPRVLEKIYDKIIFKGRKLKGVKKYIFDWALRLGLKYKLYGENGRWYSFKLSIARKLVFGKWKDGLGGNIDVIISGGAALQERLARIFWAAGIRVLEGYGLSETSPVIAVSNFEPYGVKFGTVGPPLKEIDVKIADDGEILCKGPCLMKGYYKDDELTKTVIDDQGWFHTGDIGSILEKGQLKITGRKKLIFKTSFGKYISPQPIEMKFRESVFIDQIMVVGENQKFAAALIVPDFENLKMWCKKNKIEFVSKEDVVKNPDVRKFYKEEVNKYNTFIGDTEKIKKIELIGKEWTVETNEISATLKLRRTILAEVYKDIIDGMFK